MEESINVLGGTLESCSVEPMTGWFRDGCCNTDNSDFGRHIVCVVMTDVFLAFSKGAGNDLSTSNPGFPGLKEGDGWCVCASSYAKAAEAGKGCPIYLKRTHEKTLKLISIESLKKYAIDLS